KWVARGSEDFTIILWDTSGNIAQQWVAHDYSSVSSLAFSPDSRFLVSGGENAKLAIWDLSQGPGVCRVTVLEGHAGPVSSSAWLDITATFDPGSMRLATVSRWDGVEVWDVETGGRQAVLRRAGEVQDISFSRDGRLLVTASSDRTVKI
ncbi:WD40-repeat-containing domain protein, partial [Ganoderma leucocontextum]